MFSLFSLFRKQNKEIREKMVKDLTERMGAMEERFAQREKVQNAPGMFFIKTNAGTFANTQFKSISRNGQHIELRFYDMDYIFKSQKPKEVYNAIVNALANASARLVPCVINEAPTPYGMFSYRENPYPGPVGEDLIVDIDAIVKKVRG